MWVMDPRHRRPALLLVALVAAAAIAVPALGQEGSASPSASATATAEPAASTKPQKPGKPDKAAQGDRVPEEPVSLTGRIGTVTDADGETDYTLTVGSTVYTLETGPRWWWGDKNPLAGLVGRSVLVEGERAQGATSIDVFVAGGTTIRAAGKPPWAGGWKVVGERHPGWAQWKVDKWADRLAKWAAKWPDGKPGKGPLGAEGSPAP